MAQNYQSVARRKENISAIEPLISAMRTISLSQWRMALNRQAGLNAFLQELESANASMKSEGILAYAQPEESQDILIVLGSNRGLCGNFNKHLVQYAKNELLHEKKLFQVILVGKQLPALFKRFQDWPMSEIAFPDIAAVQHASSVFALDSLEKLDGKSVTVLYNRYQGAGQYETINHQIYPIQPQERSDSRLEQVGVILDTDARSLLRTLQYLTFSAHLQACLYASLASEHSARFALMETADQNIENLITELEMQLQDYRKGKITAETQELAVSSGLLKAK
jgi:F-type H+-transporting ATPase subunit gamma